MFGINIKDKTATLYDEGTVKFSTTTLPTVGKAVASLLALPVESSTGPALSNYKNKFVYISSFYTSQREILDAVETATGTTDSNWKIEKKSVQEHIDDGWKRFQVGDFLAIANVIYGYHFKEGMGGDFVATKGTATEILGLPKEDIVKVTRGVVEKVQ